MLLSAVAGQGGIKVPGAPGTLSLSNGSTSGTMIDLSWSAPSDTGGGTISGYRIKKDGSVLVADTGSTGTTYTATGLTRLTEYNFNVAAINEKGTGADGNTPSHTTTAEVPGAPGTLSLAEGTDGNTQIDLSWSAPSDTGGATVTGYRIKKGGSVLVADTGSTGTTYTASGLTGGTSYNFNVAAINSIGTGADGNTPSRTTTNTFGYTTTGSPTLTAYSGYNSLRWTGSGSLIVSNHASTDIDIYGIGGGGAGGGTGPSGGGGQGGVQTITSQTLTNTTYTVTIGAGATGTAVDANGDNGANTTFGALMTANGGGGGGKNAVAGSAGGCGGGGGKNAAGGSGSQGGNGGAGGCHPTLTWACGGGGGGGASNGEDMVVNGGIGSDGPTNDYFDGTTDSYGGGGGGGGTNDGGAGGSPGGGDGEKTTAGGDGTDGTGGGGGGYSGGAGATGGDGGDGICIIRWAV